MNENYFNFAVIGPKISHHPLLQDLSNYVIFMSSEIWVILVLLRKL